MGSNKLRVYNKLIIAVSILVPVVVAILFTVRIPNVEPLSFLPPIYASINALWSCANARIAKGMV